MSRAAWMVRIDMMNFFENKAELRARTEKGLTHDKIYRGVFAATLEDAFDKDDIKVAVKEKLIVSQQIRVQGSIKNVYLWLEKECKHQPTPYKRWIARAKDWLVSRGILR